MKSEIRLKLECGEWKNYGSSMYKCTKMNFEKAMKAIKNSFKDEGIVPTVVFEGEYAVITGGAR